MSDFFKKLFTPITATLDFIQKYFKSLLFIFILMLIFIPAKKSALNSSNLAELYLTGPIISATNIVQKIDNLSKEKNIKGVLFIVNSPGGAVAPSAEISMAIKRLNHIKPVVAYAAGTMASGSYYASIWADKIIANPASTIGSIGVIMEGFNIKRLADKIGIEPQVIKAGKYKEAGTPFRKWNPDEKQEINQHVQDIYHLFVSDVAKARNLNIKNSKNFADAKIFISSKAKKIGLIDYVGSIYDAKKLTQALAHVKQARWKRKSPFERYMEQFIQESSRTLAERFKGWIIN